MRIRSDQRAWQAMLMLLVRQRMLQSDPIHLSSRSHTALAALQMAHGGQDEYSASLSGRVLQWRGGVEFLGTESRAYLLLMTLEYAPCTGIAILTLIALFGIGLPSSSLIDLDLRSTSIPTASLDDTLQSGEVAQVQLAAWQYD